ncbi:protein FAM161B isoform X1 [Alosa sapidissima]|uniref:protein FAM161B isoform X1 n=1 Tax=Alosa sapidissima TaxID=34773 RepID=UPI001C0A4703|nr:protein FAM161B isoform X1 [Alosa sapidissima]
MQSNHRNNIIVTSCLKTPVDPYTKTPLALYERERVLPYATKGQLDNRDYEKEMEYDSECDVPAAEEDSPGKGSPLLIKDYRVTGDHIDLREFYFSNEEYYRKLEQLKKAHLHTMSQLEQMYRKKLELKGGRGPGGNTQHPQQTQWGGGGLVHPGCRLKKSHSAHELCQASDGSDDEDEENRPEKGLLLSPKERIKNMWQDFSVDKPLRSRRRPGHHDSFSSLQSQPGDDADWQDLARGKVKGRRGMRKKVVEKRKKKKKEEEEDGGGEGGEGGRPRATVPQPFNMTLREAERKRRGVKTRAEVERENAELRRQLEDLTECQRQFRASPMPAHVRLPLYEELQRRRDRSAAAEDGTAKTSRSPPASRPFSFLERERLKREQREEELRRIAQEEALDARGRPAFRAKPVPRAVREVAAANERLKEEQLYRAIKMQMRARDLLHSASMPPSMLARRLEERKQKEEERQAADSDRASHRPKINPDVPDFDASYRRFQKQLERGKRESKPLTACEPFRLRTASLPSRRERVAAPEADTTPRDYRWPFLSSPSSSPRQRRGPPRTSSSSLCSSLSGSQEVLSAKITDAARKRQDAIRKVLEQKQKAEEEEKRWLERQRERERRLQKVITRRAQAIDPHQTLAQTCPSKLKEFRKQDQQRRREYREEMKEIQERVRGRPLLLEQVARNNAKQAAERRYVEALKACGLSEDFVQDKALKNRRSRSESPSVRSLQSNSTRRGKDAARTDSVSLNGSLHDYQDDYEEYQDGEDKDEEEGYRKREYSQYESDGEDQSDPERREGDSASNDNDDPDYNEDDQDESDKGSDIIDRHKDSQSSRSN